MQKVNLEYNSHMNFLEGMPHNENKLTRATMPKEVFAELTHHEELYPDFHAYNYIKSCTTPEDCLYVITGNDLVGDNRESKKAKLTITYKKEGARPKYTVTSSFEYIEEPAPENPPIEKLAA